jgi:hypothetical protein
VLARLRERFNRHENVRTVVGVGDSPDAALARIRSAFDRETEYECSRVDHELAIAEPGAPVRGLSDAMSDVLHVKATAMDFGTRVELRGRVRPEIVHFVLMTLAKSRPWVGAPAWDDPA